MKIKKFSSKIIKDNEKKKNTKMSNLEKKTTFIIFILSLMIFSISVKAQYNEWTWVKGDSTAYGTAVYGTKGIPDINNTPNATYEACEWTDLNGNCWLLTNDGYFWKYNPVNNMWTWMNAAGAFMGVKGIPSASTYPGPHNYAANTWTDNNNNLWLYGGTIVNTNWDPNLWKYNISTGMWTWMNGPGLCGCMIPVYGTLGLAAPTNNPGSRTETSASWTDSNGNFWLFGGLACDGDCNAPTSNGGLFSDIWKFDISLNNWIWMSGSSTLSQPPVYGTQGVGSINNTPGGRQTYAAGKQHNGEVLLFGGKSSSGAYNDLWKYNFVTDQWTWLNGPTLANQSGMYGTKCIPGTTNIPGSGDEIRIRWTDDCGNLWLFGSGETNDLWSYSVINNTWTWVSGTNIQGAAGIYNTIGTSATSSIPSFRLGGNAWRTSSDFYLFGGKSGFLGNQNDLWRYRPGKPIAQFTNGPITGCLPITVNFNSTSEPGCNEIKSYLWDFGDSASGNSNRSILINPSHSFNTNGTFSVKLLVVNCTGSKDSTTQIVTVQTASADFSYLDGTYCQNVSNPLPSYANGGINGTFTSSPNLSINSNTGEINLLASLPGTYTITNTITASACSIIPATAVIVIVAPPVITVNSPNICKGQTANLIANGGATYIWSAGLTITGFNTADASPTATTTFKVVGSANNCSDTSLSLVTVFSLPSVNAGNDITIVAGSSTELNGICGGTYTWTPIDGLSCTNCPNPIASPSQTTTYTLTVTDTNGCSATDDATIKIDCGDIFVPNFFSPNSDNQNDLECIYGKCIESITFAIFNRWGEKVFETNDKQQCWDGTYKGKLLDDAVFTYFLKAKLITGEEISKQGNISLIK